MAAVMVPIETSSFREQLDELRCHDTPSLKKLRGDLAREKRRIELRELAVLRVLDEREDLRRVPDPKVSAQTARRDLELARQLESLPQVAQQLADGELSVEQAAPLAQLATPDTDQEWATRGPNIQPSDLHRMVRRQERPTGADATARRDARFLRIWREDTHGMVAGRFRLPDVDGIMVEKVLLEMTEKMRPAKGERWASLDHRQADALVQLCRDYSDVEVTDHTRSRPQVVLHLRVDGSTDCEGIPVARETVDAALAAATLKLRVEHPNGLEIHSTRARRALPEPKATAKRPDPARRRAQPPIDGLPGITHQPDAGPEQPDARAGPSPLNRAP